MRLLLASAIAMGLLCANAQAQGIARLAVIGFSEDGGAFAMEQFSPATEEKALFSEISILDVATGQHLPGSPIRSVANGSSETIDAVRRMSYTSAARVLSRLRVKVPGTVAARRSGAPADPAAATADIKVGKDTSTLKLESRPIRSQDCERLGVSTTALRLMLAPARGEPRLLVDEMLPPAERLCPGGYAIAEVRTFERAEGPPVLATVVAMDRPAFGAMDRRYFVVLSDLAAPAPDPKAAE